MPEIITDETLLEPGDFFEDCAFHPCLCLSADREEDEICGVSLVDGSFPRSCSFVHCGVRKLSREEAIHWKFFGPPDAEVDTDLCWTRQVPKDAWIEQFRINEINGDRSRT